MIHFSSRLLYALNVHKTQKLPGLDSAINIFIFPSGLPKEIRAGLAGAANDPKCNSSYFMMQLGSWYKIIVFDPIGHKTIIY